MSSPQGTTAREERAISDRLKLQDQNNVFPIGIKTPLELGKKQTESLFKMNYEIENQINDNLKNLLMTKKGEKLCYSDYGTRLYEIYSLDNTMEEIYSFAMDEISSAVLKYMPSINLLNYYSKLLEEKDEIDKILKDPTQIKRAERGYEFFNSQNSLEITRKGRIEKNKESINNDIIYQITVEYSIPKLSNNKSYFLTMNLLTSK